MIGRKTALTHLLQHNFSLPQSHKSCLPISLVSHRNMMSQLQPTPTTTTTTHQRWTLRARHVESRRRTSPTFPFESIESLRSRCGRNVGEGRRFGWLVKGVHFKVESFVFVVGYGRGFEVRFFVREGFGFELLFAGWDGEAD